MIELTINNRKVSVPEGTTILDAAKTIGITIPTLCYFPNQTAKANCRVCVVEVEGYRTLQASCSTPVAPGMVVKTNSAKAQEARKVNIELILANHDANCLECSRNLNCELQKVANQAGITVNPFESVLVMQEIDNSSAAIVRNPNKCIKCGRCIEVCRDVQGLNIIDDAGRSADMAIVPSFGKYLSDSNCVACGQCAVVCPVAAITEKDEIGNVWDALNDPSKRVIVQTAPAVRVALGEEFGLAPGTPVTGKMAASLRALGFDDIFDTNFAADLTIMEEGTEFLTRVKNALTGGKATLPMITSCSPGWINFVEINYPELLEHLSTCKSPHQMLGALIKTYYADKVKVKPEDIYVVSVMPCTAKKHESKRPELSIDGIHPDVDAVLTTRELARMIKQAGVDFINLPDEEFDNPLGLSTGAADIFGVTGGVMEAALRTVYEIVTGRALPFDGLHVTPIVGLEGIKEATIKIENPVADYAFLDGVEVKVAVASSTKNAKVLMDQIAAGTSPYHFIEIMGCLGGCITGGGQPRSADPDVRIKRLGGMYSVDEAKVLRKSHDNPYINSIYEEYLGVPNGHLSHELLHTHYTKRGKV